MKYMIAAAFIFLGLTSRSHAAEETIISDRPGSTDNPKSQAPGEFRTETGVYSYTHNVSDGVRTTKQTFGNVYLIGGVAKNVELQAAYDGFSTQVISNGDERNVTRQSGGETVRLKWSVIGNHDGKFSLALLPRLQHPQGVDGTQWQGALGLPLAYDLDDDWNLSVMPEWRIETNDDGQRAHGFYNGVVLEHDLNERWGVFAQNAVHTQHVRDDWDVTLGAGGTMKATKRLQLDVSADFGLTSAANTFFLQAGFTYIL